MELKRIVLNNIRIAIKLGFIVKIRMTINKYNIDNFGNSVIEFFKMGVDLVDILYEQNPGTEEFWKDKHETYLDELLKIKMYIDDFQNRTGFKKILNFLEAHNTNIKMYNRPCEAGRKLWTVSTDGDIYPCHRVFAHNKAYKLGNVITDEFNYELLTKWWNLKFQDSECTDCANPNCYKCPAYNMELYDDPTHQCKLFCLYEKINYMVANNYKKEDIICQLRK